MSIHGGVIGATIGRPPGGISREARDPLIAYSWPGNVRELRETLEIHDGQVTAVWLRFDVQEMIKRLTS